MKNLSEHVLQAKKKIENEVEEFRKEKLMQQAQALGMLLLTQGTTKPKATTKQAKRVKRQYGGFTTKDKFVPIVIKCLQAHGAMRKGRLVKEIRHMNVLNSHDYFQHQDKQPRYYKTLDKTRTLMINKGLLKTNMGIWELA